MHHGKQEVLKGLPSCAKASTWHPVLGGFMVDRPGGISLEVLRQGPLPQPHTHLPASGSSTRLNTDFRWRKDRCCCSWQMVPHSWVPEQSNERIGPLKGTCISTRIPFVFWVTQKTVLCKWQHHYNLHQWFLPKVLRGCCGPKITRRSCLA